jgi:hypothetical protein
MLILMGVLVGLLSACGPPDPSLIEAEDAESEMTNDGIVE